MITQLLVVAVLAVTVHGHSYHLGSCPSVEPLSEFNMNKFLGKWYVIQKTSTGSRCLLYNFTASSEPNEYELEQVSEHPVLGLASVDNKYHYTGHLKALSTDTPAKMTVRFPLSVAGSASYTVFATDYDTYGAIFTCQKLAFANRQSATILSRKKTLDKMFLDKGAVTSDTTLTGNIVSTNKITVLGVFPPVRGRLSSFGVDPYELSVIDQANCPSDADETKVNINIDKETFSPQSIAGVVRKAGDKIGDGVEVVAEGAKKLYDHVSSNDGKPSGRDREEIVLDQTAVDDQWLP